MTEAITIFAGVAALFLTFCAGAMKDENQIAVDFCALLALVSVAGCYFGVCTLIGEAKSAKSTAWERLQTAQSEYLEATK
jgi:hypothetical protein